MNWYRNLRISVKLIWAFLIVALIAGAIGLIGMFNLNTVSKRAEYLYEYGTEPIVIMAEILDYYQENRVETRNLVFMDTSDDVSATVNEMKARANSIRELMDRYDKTIWDDEGREQFEIFKTAHSAYVPMMEEILELILNGKKQEAANLLTSNELQNTSKKVQTALVNIIGKRVKDSVTEYEGILDISKYKDNNDNFIDCGRSSCYAFWNNNIWFHKQTNKTYGQGCGQACRWRYRCYYYRSL